MLKNTKKMGSYLVEKLGPLKQKFNCILEVRGIGLMVGIQLNIEGKNIIDDCFQQGLIINCTQGNVLRVMPALNITKKQIDKAVGILDKVLENITQK